MSELGERNVPVRLEVALAADAARIELEHARVAKHNASTCAIDSRYAPSVFPPTLTGLSMMTRRTTPHSPMASPSSAAAFNGINAPETIGALLMATDFQKVYDVYLFQIQERTEATKLYITIFLAPFVLLSAFGLTSVVEFVDKSTTPPLPKSIPAIIAQFPTFMYLIFFLSGCIGLIPYHRFIAAHGQAYKMIRYMNNFRKLYYNILKPYFSQFDWEPRAEANPDHPLPKMGFHWVSFLTILMAVMNTAYITGGLVLFDKSEYYIGPTVACLVSLALHFLLWRTETRTKDITPGRVSS